MTDQKMKVAKTRTDDLLNAVETIDSMLAEGLLTKKEWKSENDWLRAELKKEKNMTGKEKIEKTFEGSTLNNKGQVMVDEKKLKPKWSGTLNLQKICDEAKE